MEGPSSGNKKLLITGASGSVGAALVTGLRERYRVRGFDRRPMPGLDDAVVGDLADFEAVLKAVEGVDAIIHLAAIWTGDAPWEDILQNNIIGTYNVFEAARQSGVRRIAFASRAALYSSYPPDVKRTVDLPLRPRNYYSVSKAFGESLGFMYFHEFNMEVVCIRIGSFVPNHPKLDQPEQLSARDAVRVFERAVIHPGVKFEVVFGVSDSSFPRFDIAHGVKAIGYQPLDKSIVQAP